MSYGHAVAFVILSGGVLMPLDVAELQLEHQKGNPERTLNSGNAKSWS